MSDPSTTTLAAALAELLASAGGICERHRLGFLIEPRADGLLVTPRLIDHPAPGLEDGTSIPGTVERYGYDWLHGLEVPRGPADAPELHPVEPSDELHSYGGLHAAPLPADCLEERPEPRRAMPVDSPHWSRSPPLAGCDVLTEEPLKPGAIRVQYAPGGMPVSVEHGPPAAGPVQDPHTPISYVSEHYDAIGSKTKGPRWSDEDQRAFFAALAEAWPEGPSRYEAICTWLAGQIRARPSGMTGAQRAELLEELRWPDAQREIVGEVRPTVTAPAADDEASRERAELLTMFDAMSSKVEAMHLLSLRARHGLTRIRREVADLPKLRALVADLRIAREDTERARDRWDGPSGTVEIIREAIADVIGEVDELDREAAFARAGLLGWPAEGASLVACRILLTRLIAAIPEPGATEPVEAA